MTVTYLLKVSAIRTGAALNAYIQFGDSFVYGLRCDVIFKDEVMRSASIGGGHVFNIVYRCHDL